MNSLTAVGGTFDHFHLGHQQLLKEACAIGNPLIVGITEPVLNQFKPYAHLIEDFEVRKNSVITYLNQIGCQNYTIVSLTDWYGPLLTEPTITKLVVGPKIKGSIEKINNERSERGYDGVELVTATVIKSQDGQIISSTRIRQGVIDREGFAFAFLLKKEIKIGDDFRIYLQETHGITVSSREELVKQIEKKDLVVWVGDQVGAFFYTHKIPFDLGVFDLRSERKENTFFAFLDSKDYLQVVNQAGIISTALIDTVVTFLDGKDRISYLRVVGEEDLTVVPFLLLSPLKSKICYGIPRQGMILLEVTERKKAEIKLQLLHNERLSINQ